MMMPGSKGQKAVHACMIRLLNLGPAKHLCTPKTLYTEKPLTGRPYPCFSGYFIFVFAYIPRESGYTKSNLTGKEKATRT